MGSGVRSQSLVNEGRFPLAQVKSIGKKLKKILSQSLVNEGRFPHEIDLVRDIPIKNFLSQSLVNEGRFPLPQAIEEALRWALEVAIPR